MASKQVRISLLCVAAYLGIALLPFRIFLPRYATHLIGNHPDTLLQHLHCAWQWLALEEGRYSELLRLPTLHPYPSGLAFGEPLIGVTLPFAPAYLLTGSTAAAFNTSLIASFLLLELAIYLWVRELFASAAAGWLAAVLVIFSPWRLHHFTALNLLTVHYAVFGLWLVSRWLRRPQLASLLGAAFCLHLQLVTAAQAGIVALGLLIPWLAVVWARSGLRLDARRLGQLACALLFAATVSLPWLAFFEPAFQAARGLPRTDEMHRYGQSFTRMAQQVGAFGPLGIFAAMGVPAAWLAVRRRILPPGAGSSLLGLGLGGALLFVLARGPYVGSSTDPIAMPHALASGIVPLLDAFRAPIRLAAFSPLVLGVFAGGGAALLERLAAQRRGCAGSAIVACAPMLLALLWPPLEDQMAAPIALRPEDRALASALAGLPTDSVILSLPLDLEPSGALVDERVLVHRRAQVGGFASILPPVFPQLAAMLGQWPDDGQAAAQALGVTHLVVPTAWLRQGAGADSHQRFRAILRVGARTIVALPSVSRAESAFRVRIPSTAAVGRWLTLSVYQRPPGFHPRGHQKLRARWRSPELTLDVDALALFPGIVSSDDPILIHVPTPDAPGRHALRLELSGLAIEGEVDVRHRSTTADAAIRDASIALADGYLAPRAVRASSHFRVAVRVEAGAGGPILLASSRRRLPDRQGETLVVFEYRSREEQGPAPLTLARPGLSGDLEPGGTLRQTWYLKTPRAPGVYDLLVRLAARGDPEPRMPWTPLISGLRVEAE